MTASEARFFEPDERCPHPERWHSTDEQSTEVEVSELVGALVVALQPNVVVEIGTASGQTTREIEQALKRNGHGRVYSIDADADAARAARETLDPHGPAEVIVADSLLWPPPGAIDLLFVDGQLDRASDVRRFKRWLRKGSVVVVHDTAPGRGFEGRRIGDEVREELASFGRLLDLPTPRGVTICEYVAEAPRQAPGTVVVTADESGRYSRFMVSMNGLQTPPGSITKWMLSTDVPGTRNEACADFLGEWVWFVDDDHTFPSDTVMRLLSHGADVVAPLVLRRQQPFLPVACVDDDFLDLGRYGPDELVEVQATGSSGMLIRRHVLEAIEPPWFDLGYDPDGRRVSEDIAFCRRVVEAGFRIHVDLGVRMGHITTAVVVPAWHEAEGRWLTGFDVADGAKLMIERGTFIPEAV